MSDLRETTIPRNAGASFSRLLTLSPLRVKERSVERRKFAVFLCEQVIKRHSRLIALRMHFLAHFHNCVVQFGIRPAQCQLLFQESLANPIAFHLVRASDKRSIPALQGNPT